jgi:hypothetical protein
MSDNSKSRTRSLTRTFVWYSFGTACGVALAAGVLLTTLDDHLTVAEVSSAIGLNLIASVVFALMFVALANWVQDRNVQSTIRDGFRELGEQVMHNVATADQMFVPQKMYEPVNPGSTYGDDFNRDVTRDLEVSNFFAFNGPSARYVAARLLAARHQPTQIRIAMIGPANRQAIHRRAFDRRSWAGNEGQTIERIKRDLRRELLVNVVGLFECRHICPIEILYIDGTAVYRHVMLDKAMYLSWYFGPKSAQMELPESYRFARESFVYELFQMDLARKFEMAEDRVVFNANHDDQFLLGHLRQITGEDIPETELELWRAEHKKESKSFSTYMGQVYSAIYQAH